MACGVICLITEVAHAQLAQNLTMGSPKALSLGNAVTADPPGIDSIHFNPAGLTRIKGRKQHLKFIMGDAGINADFIADAEYLALIESLDLEDPAANTSSEIDAFAAYLPGLGLTEIPVIAAPLGGLSFQSPDQRFTFASAVYAPLLLGYKRADDDPGIYYGREAGMTRLTYLSPSVAWKVNEELSVGVAIPISYVGIGASLDFRAASPVLGAAEHLRTNLCDQVNLNANDDICGDAVLSPFGTLITLEGEVEKAFSPTFNLGILWQPTAWFSWGFVYQSEAADTLEGEAVFILKEDLVNFVGAIVKSNRQIDALFSASLPGVNQELFIDDGRVERDITLDFTLPQHIATGISVQLLPDLKVNLDYKWTETSTLQEAAIIADEPVATLELLSFIEGVEASSITIPRHYEDAANWAIGLEYHYSDRLALRLGYEPRKSGVPDDKRDFLLPLGDFDLYGVGFEYNINAKEVFDLAIGYGKIDEYVAAGESDNGNDLRADNFLYNPSAGLDVHYTLELLLIEMSYVSEF